MVKLSVLDQSPVPSGSTPAEALRDTVALAQAVERLGYTRFWVAEHHGSPGLAGSAPEVLVARLAAATSTIRVGAGGVMLSHYSPLKVAETFRVLAGLFPGRIDLGIGRADGASPAVTSALQAGSADAALPFGRKVAELLAHLGEDDAVPRAVPQGVDGPDPWLLASSSDGAGAASTLGLPLCFAHFISSGFGPQIVERYRRDFQPAEAGVPAPQAVVAVAAVCADTDAEARELASSGEVWRLADENGRGPVLSPAEVRARGRTQVEGAVITQNRKGLVVGDPERACDELSAMAKAFGVDELVVLTVCHDPRARLRSYELLAEAFDL